jgi:hypothetical protein
MDLHTLQIIVLQYISIFFCFHQALLSNNEDSSVLVLMSLSDGYHLTNLVTRITSTHNHDCLKSESESELYYNRRSVGQSILVSSPHLGFMTRFLLLSDHCGFLIWGALSDERRGLSFTMYNAQYTIHFTVSDLRLPQPGGPGPCIYIPQGQGGPVIPQALGILNLFLHLLLLNVSRWSSLHGKGKNIIENTALKSSSIVGCASVAADICLSAVNQQ